MLSKSPQSAALGLMFALMGCGWSSIVGYAGSHVVLRHGSQGMHAKKETQSLGFSTSLFVKLQVSLVSHAGWSLRMAAPAAQAVRKMVRPRLRQAPMQRKRLYQFWSPM